MMMDALRPKFVNFTKSWQKLEKSFIGLLEMSDDNKNITRDEWLQLFVDVYAITISTDENMYEKLYKNVDRFLSAYVKDISASLGSLGDGSLLQSYALKWANFVKGLDLIDRLFSHINRQYVKNPISRARIRSSCTHLRIDTHLDDANEFGTRVWLSIFELGLFHWRQSMLPKFNDLTAESIRLIQRDRHNYFGSGDNQSAEGELVKAFCESLVRTKPPSQAQTASTEAALGYKEIFEGPMSRELCAHYNLVALDGVTVSDPDSAYAYMTRVLSLIEQERERSKAFVHPSSYDLMEMGCRKCLLKPRSQTINSCLDDFFETKNFKAIDLYYKLFDPMNDLHELIRALSDFVHRRIVEGVSFSDPKTFVENFVSVREGVRESLINAGLSGQVFIKTFDTAIFKSLNDRGTAGEQKTSAPMLLSMYINDLIEERRLDPRNPDASIHNALLLLGYISDKDMFYRVYLRQTAMRLLYFVRNSADSQDAKCCEQLMYRLFKPSDSCEFTTRLQHMLMDFESSQTVTAEFDSASSGPNMPFKFAVSVFRTSAWPLMSDPCDGVDEGRRLPCKQLEHAVNQFTEFYMRRHSGRKLHWLHTMSTVEVRMLVKKRSYSFTLTMGQFKILHALDGSGARTIQELKRECVCADFDDAIRCMLDKKLVTLSKQDGIVRLNMRFFSRLIKQNLTSYARSTDKLIDSETKLRQSVNFDRDHYLQALIIRVLKTEKVLKHAILMSKIIDESKNRFVPDVDQIKRSIESLVEREFIAKSGIRSDEYTYLA